MPAVGCRVDQPGPAVVVGEQVAGPEVTVQPRGWLDGCLDTDLRDLRLQPDPAGQRQQSMLQVVAVPVLPLGGLQFAATDEEPPRGRQRPEPGGSAGMHLALRLRDGFPERVVVAGGAGVGSAEAFALIRELADTLGGVVGATRAAVDAGWIDHQHQVGQTGTTVRPRLYIAAGISGAIQHRAGMDQSSKIIAINTDPNAPMFQIAHYRIVGDVGEVLPMIIKTLRERSMDQRDAE